MFCFIFSNYALFFDINRNLKNNLQQLTKAQQPEQMQKSTYTKNCIFSHRGLQGTILTASTDFCPIPTMFLRGPATQHLKTSAKREFDGTGWTGWTGRTGGKDGHEKCASIFFILCK